MTKPSEEEVHEALRVIVHNRDHKSLNWCVNSAKAGLELVGENLRLQCIYILGNMTHWTGADAKEVRRTLKAFIGG